MVQFQILIFSDFLGRIIFAIQTLIGVVVLFFGIAIIVLWPNVMREYCCTKANVCPIHHPHFRQTYMTQEKAK